MKLNEFFAHSEQKDFLHSIRIINIIWPSKPAILFLQAFLNRLKVIKQQQLVMCDMQEQSSAAIQSQLAMSFLGTSCIYSIDLCGESTKLDVTLRSYLDSYTGTHLIIVGTSQDHALRERADVAHLFVEEVLDQANYCVLYKFLHDGEISDKRFVQELFRRSPKISLDMALIMMHYQLFVGKNIQHFFSTWFDRIVEQKQSLFILSQHLFARDAQRFYLAWQYVAQEYPSEFWIAFWSEQIWQAIIFITIAKQEGVLAAKKSVSRLPFSFMQKDWNRHTLEQLTLAHDRLYQIDYANKNGAITEALDIWYAKFLI